MDVIAAIPLVGPGGPTAEQHADAPDATASAFAALLLGIVSPIPLIAPTGEAPDPAAPPAVPSAPAGPALSVAVAVSAPTTEVLPARSGKAVGAAVPPAAPGEVVAAPSAAVAELAELTGEHPAGADSRVPIGPAMDSEGGVPVPATTQRQQSGDPAAGRIATATAIVRGPASAATEAAPARADLAAAAPATPEPGSRADAAPASATPAPAGATPVAPQVGAPAAAPLSAAPVAEAPVPPGIERALAAQVVHRVGTLRHDEDGTYELSIELEPAELGRVRVSVTFEAGVVHVQVGADASTTHDLLRRSLPELRGALADAGLTAGQLDVGDQLAGRDGGHRPGEPGEPAETGRSDDPVPPSVPTRRARVGVPTGAVDVLL